MKYGRIAQPRETDAAALADDATLAFRVGLLKELADSLMEVLHSMNDDRRLDIRTGLDLYAEVRRFEVELINSALWHAGGNQREAARLLGLKATTLNSKMKQYGIPPRGAPRPQGASAQHGRGDEDGAPAGRAAAPAGEIYGRL